MADTNLDLLSSVPQAFFSIAKAHPELLVYEQALLAPEGRPGDSRVWEAEPYADTAHRVIQIANFLRTCGVTAGTPVAIISNSRPEWMEADLAILSLGGIVVSVYQSLPPLDIGYILYDSKAKVVLVENIEQAQKIEQLKTGPFKIPATEERPAGEVSISIEHIISFEPCSELPSVVSWRRIFQADILSPLSEPPEIAKLRRSDIATLVYTSGTTGAPKGVLQTHGNHLANIRQAQQSGIFGEDSSLMLFLPLAHSFAKLVGYVGFLTPVTLKFPAIASAITSRPDPESVSRDIREGSARIVPLVPRLLEKMREGILAKAERKGLAAALLRLTLRNADSVYAHHEQGRSPSAVDTLLWKVLAFVRRSVRNKLFGPHFAYAISGGAKLPAEVNRFFDSLGIEILEGYGLTETCVATNVNRFGKKRIGTVGPVLASDVELRFAEDREILFRGPNVALGYHDRPTATAQSWDGDGWFRTGDLGSLDEDGFLSVDGRKKEIIVLSTGKKLATELIEEKFKSSRFISQISLFGDMRAHPVAIVTLNITLVRAALSAHPDIPSETDLLASDSRVKKLLNDEVKRINLELATFETVRAFEIVAEEFTVDNGLLTPTFKVKRREVAIRFREVLEDLYRQIA